MNHIIGMLFSPHQQWEKIRDQNQSMMSLLMTYLLIIALLPPIAWYYGSTQVGWAIGDRQVKITADSAIQISILFYLAIVMGTAGLGFMVHWMSETYEAHTSTIHKGMAVAAYTLTPLFVAGAIGFYPLLWIDILIGCAAAGYTVYLLYIGVPIVMEIPKERGFLFASAMVAVGLVATAALLGATVTLWEMGAMPVFTE